MMEEQIFESFFINLHLENKILVVGTIYRTPDELIASNNKFLNLLDDKLKIVNRQKHKNSVIFAKNGLAFSSLSFLS